MHLVQFLTSLLALTVAAVSASAQQANLQFADSLTPASLNAAGPVLPENLEPMASGTALFRPITPEPAPEHKFFDRQQLLALYVHSGIRLADTIKTCRSIAHGGVEEWIPSQSCGGIAAWQAGSVGLALGVGWLFHKHGHHTLERITPWVGTGASVAGLTKSVFNIH